MWPFTSGRSTTDHEESSDTNTIARAAENSGIGLTEEQRIRIFGKPGPAVTSRTQTRDEQADAELDGLIKSFTEAAAAPHVSQIARAASASQMDQQESLQKFTGHDRTLPDGSLDISPDATYPRTMSCKQQFDQAFYCQSLGGKFNDIYRYGHLKSCSEQWSAFWFCMRTRTLPELQKAAEIKNYYATREQRRKEEHGSSEDIWEIRNTAVQNAFRKDPDADGETDAVKLKE